MKIGSKVKVLAPFDIAFPFEYEVTAIRDDEDQTCTINGENCEDRDFAPIFLEEV
jgi:hypothetical protein